MASGINAQGAATEFLEHANEEQQHADQIAERIVQLGGEPNFSPDGLSSRSHAEYVEGETLVDMIEEDLVAERIAIDSYREMVAYLGNDDPTTRRMLEDILAMEERHADDLASLLEEMGLLQLALAPTLFRGERNTLKAKLARAAWLSSRLHRPRHPLGCLRARDGRGRGLWQSLAAVQRGGHPSSPTSSTRWWSSVTVFRAGCWESSWPRWS